MLATNPLIAYGVERVTRREPVQLVGTESVVASEYDTTTIGFSEELVVVTAENSE